MQFGFRALVGLVLLACASFAQAQQVNIAGTAHGIPFASNCTAASGVNYAFSAGTTTVTFACNGIAYSCKAQPLPDDPNQVVADVTLRVLGGWLTGPQYKAAGAWSLGAKAFGALLRTMEGQAWVVTVAGTTAGSEPSWPAGPTAGDTLTDGSVTWTFLGSAPTLPADLEQACIDAVTMAWARRGQNLEVTSESLGNASYSYATGADGGRLSLPASTTDVLANYRRLVMA